MLDAKLIKANAALVEQQLEKRGLSGVLKPFLALDEERRKILVQVEERKNFRNNSSQQIGKMKKEGLNPICFKLSNFTSLGK